jgi:hypothetical protein
MILLVAALAAANPAAEAPRRFVERVYAGYARDDYSPLTHPERIFAPALLAEFRADARLSRGEVGFMDADPLCQCQDAGGLHPSILSLSESRATATARISIRFGDSADSRQVTLRLVRLPAGWRIADIAAADEPSLLAAIHAFNRKRSRRR